MKSRLDKSESAFPWAFHMAGLLVRNPIITRDLNLTAKESKEIWKRVNGRSSSSGQGPYIAAWYLESNDRRFQGAMIMLLYYRACKTFPETFALPHAYYHFARMTAGEMKTKGSRVDDDPAFREREQDYTIPYARALALKSEITKKSGSVELVIRTCKACNSKFLASHEETNETCPLCH